MPANYKLKKKKTHGCLVPMLINQQSFQSKSAIITAKDEDLYGFQYHAIVIWLYEEGKAQFKAEELLP